MEKALKKWLPVNTRDDMGFQVSEKTQTEIRAGHAGSSDTSETPMFPSPL